MDASKYQRMIIGYHGCDKSVTDGVLLKGAKLRKSENDYDWLGKGTYFWEHGPERALEWAQASARINDQSVLGAVIHWTPHIPNSWQSYILFTGKLAKS